MAVCVLSHAENCVILKAFNLLSTDRKFEHYSWFIRYGVKWLELPALCCNGGKSVTYLFFPFILQSSSLCVAAIHAGVVSNAVGGRINVVSSKGIPHYEATLANNVTSTG